jgi:hypothetical protein
VIRAVLDKSSIDTRRQRDKTEPDVSTTASCPSMQACCEGAGIAELERKALIAAIVQALGNGDAPHDVRVAALTVIGWLARREQGEHACTRGVVEAHRQSVRVKSSRG